MDWDYWAKPVPSFGDRAAWLWILGLAPAAHGANRTGRMFTGDRSGDFLYAALHRAGLANQPLAVHRDDGLKLRGVYLSPTLHCAPPANKPTPAQKENCFPWLLEEAPRIEKTARVWFALGGIAWESALRLARETGWQWAGKAKPKFAHGAEVALQKDRRTVTLMGCYHVSQQNTFTGRLTPEMMDVILARAKALGR